MYAQKQIALYNKLRDMIASAGEEVTSLITAAENSGVRLHSELANNIWHMLAQFDEDVKMALHTVEYCRDGENDIEAIIEDTAAKMYADGGNADVHGNIAKSVEAFYKEALSLGFINAAQFEAIREATNNFEGEAFWADWDN